MKYKSLLQSRTVWLAIFQGILGVIAAVMVVDPAIRLAGVAAVVKSIVDILLRIDTETVIG